MAEQSRSLVLGCPYLRSYAPLRWYEMEDNQEILDLINGAQDDTGIIGTADLIMSANPSDSDTIGIGGETYTFLDAPTTTYHIQRGGSAAVTLTNTVAKINSVTALLIKASAVGTSLRIQYAATAGGTPAIGTANYALAENITAAADVWNQANLNATGRDNYLYSASDDITLGAENIATAFLIPLTFTPLELYYRFVDKDGLPKPACTSYAAISGNGILVTVNNGGSPAVATDKFYFLAKGHTLV